MFDPEYPLNIFTSYAHKDEELREELDVHLAMIKRDPAIKIWNDRAIVAGASWDDAIKSEINTADILLLLISPRFLASDYIFKYELKIALERHSKKEAWVIPIILKPCKWLANEFIGSLQAIPRDGVPVTKFDDLDEALYKVANEISNAIEYVQAQKKAKGDG